MNALSQNDPKQDIIIPFEALSPSSDLPITVNPSTRLDFCYALECARQQDESTRETCIPAIAILHNAFYEQFYLTPCKRAGFAISATGELCDLFSLI